MSFRVLVIILVVAFLVAAGGVGWYLYSQEVATRGELRGSGTIEADELNLGSQIASEVKDILVEEGQTVTKGQTLVRLDDRILKDQVAAAQAGVEAAKASLAAIEDQTSSEADVAEAQGEEGGATQVEVGGEGGRLLRGVERDSQTPEQQGKGDAEKHGPGREEDQQGKRAEVAQVNLAP